MIPGGAATGDFVGRPLDVDAVVADAHVHLAIRSPLENEHAERVPCLVLVGQQRSPIRRLAVFAEVVKIKEVVGRQPQVVAADGDAHDRIVETVGDHRPLPTLAVRQPLEAHDGVAERLDG